MLEKWCISAEGVCLVIAILMLDLFHNLPILSVLNNKPDPSPVAKGDGERQHCCKQSLFKLVVLKAPGRGQCGGAGWGWVHITFY